MEDYITTINHRYTRYVLNTDIIKTPALIIDSKQLNSDILIKNTFKINAGYLLLAGHLKLEFVIKPTQDFIDLIAIQYKSCVWVSYDS